MTHTDDVKAGKFTAVFPNGKAPSAGRFYDRLTNDPDGDFVVPGSVTRNRANGLRVSWQASERAFEDHKRDDSPGIFQHWADMCETVGYYGSTTGEPPWGAGAKTATLNGRPCPPSY
jgi:hypothetical protein